jgi:hypothetical protein
MDILTIMSALGWIIAPISTYIIAKRMISPNKIFEILEEVKAEFNDNKEWQMFLLQVGALFGKGAMMGTGIGGNPRRKGGLEGILSDILGNVAQQYLPNLLGNQQETKPQTRGSDELWRTQR